MRVLILMHDREEDAGTITTYLTQRRTEIHIVKFYEGAHLPKDAFDFDAVVSMGGPMNVYEEDKYHFLAEETEFLARCFENELPILGICLGAQLMAKAGGAKVTRAPQEETGWYEVSLTDAGKVDPFFKGLPESFAVFQLHGDTFEIPREGILLATSPTCQNQAFRISNSLALQFHLEVQAAKLAIWLIGHNLREDVLKTYEKIREELDKNAWKLYDDFFGESDTAP